MPNDKRSLTAVISHIHKRLCLLSLYTNSSQRGSCLTKDTIHGTLVLDAKYGRKFVMKRQTKRHKGCLDELCCFCQVYLQQNKKKAEAKGENCHAKTMWTLSLFSFVLE
jgi:hypothetical protein